MRAALREVFPPVLSRLPRFRGKGRITLAIDRILTDASRPDSYQVIGNLNGGYPFTFDLRAWGQKFAYYYREWEGEYIRALRALYSGGAFVDVGSSLGLYVVCLGDLVRDKRGLILSIEPLPLNLERQRRNITLNQLDDLVRILPLAVGSKPGTVRLTVDASGADNNAIIAEEGTFAVSVARFDDLEDKLEGHRLALMKVDVEGYEPNVIDGAKRVIQKHRPVIFAEFNRERLALNKLSAETSWSWLSSLDYRLFRLIRGKLHQLGSPGNYENLFFLPKERAIPQSLRA